ncbi:MAG: Flp pilus assembly protein CpaB [Archangium sp.]
MQNESDYLWDKSGSDPELEAIEVSLAGLAYDGDPPVLPAPSPRAPKPSPPLKVVQLPRARPGAPWTFRSRYVPLAIAAGLTCLGFAVAWSAVQKEKSDVRKGWNLVPVLVAASDMSEGQVITLEDISQRSVPEQFVTSSVVKPDSASYLLGQKVQVAIASGDPLQWSQFESSKFAERLAARVMHRARALSIDVKGTTAVGGWIRPNDHVDIIGTFKDPLTNEQVAVTLMQNVTVVATGKISGSTNVNLLPESERVYSNVSLTVLPEEAEILALAEQLGTLTFTLRNDEDLDVIEERGRTAINTLLVGERTRVLQQKRFNTIQVIRGTSAPTTAPVLAK